MIIVSFSSGEGEMAAQRDEAFIRMKNSALPKWKGVKSNEEGLRCAWLNK